jgi:MOSC domain-containing protein YiiM
VPATVVALHQSHAGRAPLTALAQATLVEGSGLEGDRHSKPGNRRALLVMEKEALDRFELAPGAVREQVTVSGLGLHRLVFGTRLKVGQAVLEIGPPCAPCERMDEIRPGLQRELEGQRGRFVRVVQGGAIAVGDPIVVEPSA